MGHQRFNEAQALLTGKTPVKAVLELAKYTVLQ